jgi:hypothetical protein
VVVQLVHEPPPEPQVVRARVSQLPPLQQPLAQVWTSQQGEVTHSHAPVLHSWSELQALLPPHLQSPVVQASPFGCVPEQTSQASPPVPQWSIVEPRQSAPLQQPPQPLLESQTQAWLVSQRWPATHTAAEPQLHSPPAQLSARRLSQAAQAAPPWPQYCRLTAASATQVFPSQQPSQPLVVSHTQALPVSQRRPAPHAAGVPDVPHEQVPATQLLALSASQAAHALPPLPHWSVLWSAVATQVSPSQQPSGQVSGSQAGAASCWTGAASCCGNALQGPVWSPLWQKPSARQE